MISDALKEEVGRKIKFFVEDIKNYEYVDGILIKGSVATGKYDNCSDIDLVVSCKSKSYFTPPEIYKKCANVIEEYYEIHGASEHLDFRPTITSTWEFNPANYLTMNRLYLKHVHDCGIVKHQQKNFDFKKVIKRCLEATEGRKNYRWLNLVPSVIGPAFKIRSNMVEVFRGKRVEKPSYNFWWKALELLELEVQPAEKDKVIEKFCEVVKCKSCEDVANARGLINDGDFEGGYLIYKKAIEDGMGALKNYLDRYVL